MGESMCLSWVPAVEITGERLEQLRQMADELAKQELPFYDDELVGEKEEIALLRDELCAAIAFLPEAARSREVCHFCDDHLPYDCWCSGGLSGGDPPTDAYFHFSRLMDTKPIWQKLVEWAKCEKEGQA